MYCFNNITRYQAIFPAALLALAVTMAPFDAGAGEIAAAPDGAIASAGGQNYVCIDMAASHPDPRWDGMPLTIASAPGESAFLGDVRATVTDENGTILFDALCQAPVLTAGLPPEER